MARVINSFDVFDTLIARRCVEPRQVLHKLEGRVGLLGLAAARLAADQRLGALGQPYALRDIWQETRRALHLDEAAAGRFLELEVQIEHEEVIPIKENLALVRDGDVLVSDTYLPAQVVRSLLRHAGLERTVGLVVSNDGKFRGSIWPQLLARVAIEQHWGDNPHSDGQTPAEAGIKAIIYTGARRSGVEQFLVEQGWEALANLVREVRLANPFADARPQERYLWLLACQLNFPLLLFSSLVLERYASEAGVREVFFVSRDCLLWHHLYQQLFPHRRATYLYASRKCLFNPSESYLEYFRSTWQPDGVIVDLFSTGASWSRLFACLNTRGKCFFIGRVDNYAYLQDGLCPDDWLDMHTVFRNSELGTPLNKGVEMLNYAPHPVVEDVLWLGNSMPLPMLADTMEYAPALPEAAHRAFWACVQALSHEPSSPHPSMGPVADLIKAFVRFICADRQLPSIYAGHQAADAAYLQRILT